MMVRIAYFTAVTNSMNGFKSASRNLLEELPEIEILAVDSVDLRDPSQDTLRNEFIDFVGTADICIIRLMGGLNSFPVWEDIQHNKKADIFIVPAGSAAAQAAAAKNTITGKAADTLAQYAIHGGVENYRNLLKFIYNKYRGGAVKPLPVNPPALLPGQGIYHPDYPFPVDPSKYFAKELSPDKPTAGIWFHRGNWVNGNTGIIDSIIRECGKRGLNVIPLFVDMGSGPKGSLPPDKTAEQFFLDAQGKCLIDVHINLMMFSLSRGKAVQSGPKSPGPEELWFFAKHKIPVLQGILSNEDESRWKDSLTGLNPVTITLAMALPELDGNITTVPVGFKERSSRDPETGARTVIHAGEPDRIRQLVSLAANWAFLSRIPTEEKRVAILFHNHPPRNDTIGGAYLLDSPASVCALVQAMEREGYLIDGFPPDGDTLMRVIKSGLTNDSSWLDQTQIAERAADIFSRELFSQYFTALSDHVKEETGRFSGPPREDFYIPGKVFGNIFVGIQPGRKDLHDPDNPADYKYIAYYWWIRHVWKAHAVIHVGRHGSVEWLYGKGAGLSRDCYTDVALGDIPHLYIYVVNAPGEGVQAKRRGDACLVDHNVPVMDKSELYGEMAELENLLDEYDEARRNDPGKAPRLLEMVREKYRETDLREDVPVDSGRFPAMLRDRLDEIKNTQVRDGLHILGISPKGKQMIRFLAALTTVGSPQEKSLLEELGRMYPESGPDELHTIHLELLRKFGERNFNPDFSEPVCRGVLRDCSESILQIMKHIGLVLVPGLTGAGREIRSLLDGLAGRGVPTGPSGAPTRGCLEVLPTGKNFYTLDPRVIPSPAAWETGQRLAESLIDRYKEEHGKVPEHLGIVLWAGPNMRTRGDDIAEVLYLLGVRPVWNKKSGWVTDVEVIPLSELRRPRIDVTCKISGLFRDSLPNVIDLIDKAVCSVAFLEEPKEMNFVAAHVREELDTYLAEGLEREAAEKESLFRVFGVKPGGYGSGVNKLIDSGEWQDRDELGKRYIQWGGWAYAPGMMGVERKETFSRRLTTMNVTVKNQDHRESDFMDSDDWYDYHGGMIAAVRYVSGKSPAAYMGDSSKPKEIKTRSPGEEAKLVFRTRILNPKWITAMKRHGYKGALDVSRSLDNAFGWDAVAEVVEDWMYDRFAETYALDRETREWIEQVNPDALRNLIERLFEAHARGMWRVDEEMLEKLKELYAGNEKKLEEIYDS